MVFSGDLGTSGEVPIAHGPRHLFLSFARENPTVSVLYIVHQSKILFNQRVQLINEIKTFENHWSGPIPTY